MISVKNCKIFLPKNLLRAKKLDWWDYWAKKEVWRYLQPCGYNTPTWQTDRHRPTAKTALTRTVSRSKNAMAWAEMKLSQNTSCLVAAAPNCEVESCDNDLQHASCHCHFARQLQGRSLHQSEQLEACCRQHYTHIDNMYMVKFQSQYHYHFTMLHVMQ